MKSGAAVTVSKSGVLILSLALILGGVGAQASGVFSSPDRGYLVCVHSKTKVVTHPGTSSCPKGSKRIILGAQGVAGPAGTAGATGVTGAVGPAGATGEPGISGVKITEQSVCGINGTSLCKIGTLGPGGGTIFFVDYFDQYAGFNYLEAAPAFCEVARAWSTDTTTSVTAANGWSARAVGSGQANTAAILAAVTAATIVNAPAAMFADALTCGGKTDWFLGSLGEMKLMYDNLQGVGGFVAGNYWSSTEDNAEGAWLQYFSFGYQEFGGKADEFRVRPVRAF